jgi:hypothetical protein
MDASAGSLPWLSVVHHVKPDVLAKVRAVALEFEKNLFVYLVRRSDALLVKLGYASGTFKRVVMARFASVNKFALFRGLRGGRTPYWMPPGGRICTIVWMSGVLGPK